MLTVQRPLLRAVIQDGIEWTRANILISNAFPNAFETLEFVRDALTTAAGNNDQAMDILHHLKGDLDYINNMGRLVSSYILIMRLLTFYSASRAHSPFPPGSQGLLRCHRTSRIPGYWVKPGHLRPS